MSKKAVVACAIVAGIGVIVAVIALGIATWTGWRLVQTGRQQHGQMQQRVTEAEARERDQIRRRQLDLIAKDLDEAAKSAEDGEVEEALKTLRQVEEQLMIIARAAEASGDTTAAARFEDLRQQAATAISRIEAAPRDDRQIEATAAVEELQSAFADYREAGSANTE